MKELRLAPGMTASERGEAHGESFRQDIRDLAQIRTELIMKAWEHPTAHVVLEKARMHLPILEQYDSDLYQEFQGIARGSGLKEENLLVLNHYTDLRDLGIPEHSLEEGCSILHARYGEEVLLAQTWDMHATAEPFVLMLYLPDEQVWTLTITGCLALCGMSRSGFSVAINNLVMSDAKVGVSWPTLVRKMLRAHSVPEAESVLGQSPVASGHHYALVDPNQSKAWESSGSGAALVYDGSFSPYVHTNHCLDKRLDGLSRISPTSTTHDRYQQAEELLAENPTPNALELWQMMACRKNFPHSLFTDRSTAENPHGVATCARVLMDCVRGEIWARAGSDPDQTPRKYEWD
jgi:isopenicillin-N N-acyltransferase like protein